MADPLSAGITAGAGLLGGLFQSAAQRAAEKRRMLGEAEQAGFQAQQQAQAALATGQQSALSKLIEAYRSALTLPQG